MNQILETNMNKKNFICNFYTNKIKKFNFKTIPMLKKKKVFKMQFIISSFLITISIFIFSYFEYQNNKLEKSSNQLINKYNVYRLYSGNITGNYITSLTANSELKSQILGIIEIPPLDLSYPIFSDISDENLKIAPCRFYGNISNNKTGNLCIAGHNYNNSKFFSKINTLNMGDVIKIYDNKNQLYKFIVYANYEVENSDTSPIYETNDDTLEVTLVTCNNSNNKRIIVKGKI